MFAVLVGDPGFGRLFELIAMIDKEQWSMMGPTSWAALTRGCLRRTPRTRRSVLANDIIENLEAGIGSFKEIMVAINGK